MKKQLFFLIGAIGSLAPLFAQQGNVGINTTHPQSALHVVGHVRIDSMDLATHDYRVLVTDTSHIIKWIPKDSLKNQNSSPASNSQLFCNEVLSSATTTTVNMQTRVSLVLQPGNYIVFAYCEVFNQNIASGVRVQVNQGSTEIAYGAPYSDQSTFCPWSCFKPTTITVPTSFHLLWAVWPSGTGHIRNARICAIKM